MVRYSPLPESWIVPSEDEPSSPTMPTFAPVPVVGSTSVSTREAEVAVGRENSSSVIGVISPSVIDVLLRPP